jgi:voltage-gated potassium channel
MLVVTMGSMAIVLIEKDAPNGNIITGEDAVWSSIVTIAIVGYGDRFPTTAPGRLIGTAMIVVGVSLFSVLTSFVATNFVARQQTEERGLDLDTLQEGLLAAMATREAAAAREANALRTELADMRRLLRSVIATGAESEDGSVANDTAKEMEKPL